MPWRSPRYASNSPSISGLTGASGSRRIVHANVITNPTLSWVKQQIREATVWDQIPRFLVHDNDGIFGQFGRPAKVEREGRIRSYRCHLDLWLDQVIGVKGLPIPYGAPNASPRFFYRAVGERLALTEGDSRRTGPIHLSGPRNPGL